MALHSTKKILNLFRLGKKLQIFRTILYQLLTLQNVIHRK